MKRRSPFMRIVVVVIACSFGALCQANSGGADSQNDPPEKQGGLLGAFSGEDDPTDDRGPKSEAPPATEPKPKSLKPSIVHSPPDPKALDKCIEYLEGLNYETLEHAPSLEKARDRINWLRNRAQRLRYLNDKKTAATIQALEDHKKRMEERWLELAGTLKDGKERTVQEWAVLANGVLGESGDYIPPAEVEPEKAADETLDLDALEDWDPNEEPKEDENETDPLDPPKPPETVIDTTPPTLEDLIEAVKGQQKPQTMHPLSWARLLDKFGQDLAEFRAAYTAAMKRLAQERSSQYDQVAKSLRAAQRTYADLQKLDGRKGQALRRHLAYRIYQAELAQLRLQRADLSRMAEERQGQDTERSMYIRITPMAPENTLNDLARMMEVSGTAGPPEADAYKDLGAEGLPDLYPPDSNIIVDERVQYGNLIKANIARYQRKLRDIHDRMANAETLVKQRERKVLRREASKLREKDRLAGKEGHPLNEAQNRRTLREIQQELAAARPQHIQQLKAKLEADAQVVVAQLEVEYKRRDAMLEAEGPSKTD